jgi:hypothetical protein
VTSAIWRSLGIGAVTLIVIGALQLGSALGFCQFHRAAVMARSGQSEVMLTSGIGVARPGDAIFVCKTTHRFGPFALHEDLKCYCAPRILTSDALAEFLNGSCVIDNPEPKPSDNFGACQFAHCSAHFDP